jgi:hypothetical protein
MDKAVVRLQDSLLCCQEKNTCPGSRGKGLSVEAQIENTAAVVDASARRRSHPWECDSIFGLSRRFRLTAAFDQRAPMNSPSAP